ncbi:MAG: uroporphyrinogen decarboxylase family protein [Thermomicrobiales bacterium]
MSANSGSGDEFDRSGSGGGSTGGGLGTGRPGDLEKSGSGGGSTGGGLGFAPPRSGSGGGSTGGGLGVPRITRTDRVRAALAGEVLDRVPVCFWHHFKPEGSGRRLAELTLEFFDDKFDLDICKIMPDLPYPFPRKSIRDANGWRMLEPLDLARSPFVQQRLRSIEHLRAALGDSTPIIMTVFSPLTEALNFCADQETFLRHIAEQPDVVHGALETIAQNLGDAMELYIDAGADGVFFSIMGAMTETPPGQRYNPNKTPTHNYSGLGEMRYREFGKPYDLMALRRASDGWLNILHHHGDANLLMPLVLDYPVQVLSWSDRLTGQSLAELSGMTNKALMGGWHEFGALSNGPVEQIRAEAEDAIAQTNGGQRLILANGCSVPDATDEQWLHAARTIADGLITK